MAKTQVILLQFFSSSYVSIIGVRCDENSKVVKTIETVYSSNIAKCIYSVDDIDDRI